MYFTLEYSIKCKYVPSYHIRLYPFAGLIEKKLQNRNVDIFME